MERPLSDWYAFVCQRPDCGKTTVPHRTLPAICPHCKNTADWKQVSLSGNDRRFLKSIKIDPEQQESAV